MKIQRRHVGSLTALLALGASLGAGCAENESSLFVRGVLKFPEESCEVTAEPSAPVVFRGALDIEFSTEYTAALLVGNQLVRRGNAATLRTETSRVMFESADVHTFDSAGNELAAFTAAATGFADPSTGAEPGYGIAHVVLIDSGTSAAAGAVVNGPAVEVIARVIVRGHTLGGEEIATGEFQWPVDVCRGCLVFFPSEANDPLVSGPNCSLTEDGPSSICRPGVDNWVDCRACQGNPVCIP